MATDLSDTLVVAVSATALFDMTESDKLFQELLVKDKNMAIERYRQFMREHETIPLKAGTAYPLIKALLRLNRYQSTGEKSPLVEVVIMSRNSPDSGLRILNTVRGDDALPISRSAFTAGESVVDYLDAFNVSLFLTTNIDDAQRVIDSKVCAAAIVREPPRNREQEPLNDEHAPVIPDDQVRIAFDGDAVLFSDESELVYKTQGLDAFHQSEDRQQNIPLAEGPYATLLKKLSRLQERLPYQLEYSPIRIALITARNSPAEMRVIKTLRAWGVYVDEAFFLGGVEKTKVLKAFNPHIFFDDQDIHLERSSDVVPSGKVPYPSSSLLLTLSSKDKETS